METPVAELVHGAQVEVAELHELADPSQVEERVAVDGPGDVPQQDAQHEPGEGDRERVPRRRPGHDPERERQRDYRDDG
jgi:hypothetical protein